MEFSLRIQEVLRIPSRHIKQYASDEVLCLVHVSWMKFICTGLKLPEECLEKELSDDKLLYLFSTLDLQESCDWKFIAIYLIKKRKGKIFKFFRSHEKSLTPLHLLPLVSSLSYSQLIHYVTKTNYKNLWEQAWKKYHIIDNIKKPKQKQNCSEVLHDIMKNSYKFCEKKREDGIVIHFPPMSSTDDKDEIHPNFLQAFCGLETSDSILLVCEHFNCSLSDCLMFSPHILSGSTVQPLFLIYQLIQAMCSVHDSGLFLGPISLSSIKVKENMWIKVIPKIWNHLPCVEKNVSSDKISNKSKEVDEGLVESFKESVPSSNSEKSKGSLLDRRTDLSSLIQGWVSGSLSNYDYLMCLNKLAGRQMNNPKCHYVMPWIMDFSVPDGGWRDLTKSKFRLNKGDKQLDLIYESATEASRSTLINSSNVLLDSAITVPHHTSDALADITYYVYKARRMPKSFLCQHVRQKWVPAEYPATIERLQEWTPDECIPEFFSDPLIFYSIHPDLSDLGVPWWCDSPEDFIKKHRNALESYHVSERLHNWIDLVFGYKLTGLPAIKSKNLCLPLVDRHTSIRNYGMVQLFMYPHPHKLSNSIYFRSLAPKTFRNLVLKVTDTKDSGDDETSSDSIGKSSFF